MKAKWVWTVCGLAPFVAAIISVQSCGGEGGPLGGGGGVGSISQAFLNLLSPEQRTATAIGSERCADCHGGRGEPPVYQTWHETKHGQIGVGCERCHGNGSVHEANPTKTNILTFPNSTSPVVCAQCHGSIYDDFNQSSHSKIVDSPVESGLTSPNSAGRTSRCLSCHSGLFRTQTTELGVDPSTLNDAQIIDLAQNTINKVPHSASCATCHDPHKQTGNLTDEGNERQIRHKTFNVDTTDIEPGTTSDVFTKFDHICAQCHNGRGADGRDSRLSQSSATSRPNMHDSNQYNMLMGVGGSESPTGPIQRNMAHAQAPGQCSKCHMPDSSHRFTVSYDKSCTPCHSTADAAARQAALANEITNALYALRTRFETWATTTFTPATPGYTPAEMDQRLFPYLWDYSSLINEVATDLGIDTSDATKMPPTTHQTAIPIEVRRARHNYYFIIRDSSICPHNPPYSRYLILYANENMDDVSSRPVGGRSSRFGMDYMRRVLKSDKARAARADASGMRDDD